jgi:hypothetical protein
MLSHIISTKIAEISWIGKKTDIDILMIFLYIKT